MTILLGMPCVNSIPTKTVGSLLNTAKRGVVDPLIVEGSLVYDSRDFIAAEAVNKGYDYVLYADSDMIFTADDVKKLVDRNVDICSGLYISRHGEDKNVVYEKIITRRRFPERKPELIVDNTSSGFGVVAACGFGFCLIKTSVLKSMFKRYKSLFEPFNGVGEDIAFCLRAKKCGYKIHVDREVKLGHIGETVYRA